MALRVFESVDANNAASTAVPIPGGRYGVVRVVAGGAQDARVKIGFDNTVTAGAGDTLIKNGTALEMSIPGGATHIAVLSASSLVNLAFGNEV